jgi:hypothetical protein
MALARYRCCGVDSKGTKVYGWGDTRTMALMEATTAAREYIQFFDSKTGPFEKWKFTVEDRRREFEMVRGSNMQVQTSRNRYPYLSRKRG